MSNRVKFERKKSIFFVAWGGFIFKHYFYCQGLQKPTVAWFMPLDDPIHVLQSEVYVSREKKGAESMLKAIERDCETRPLIDPGMSLDMGGLRVLEFPPRYHELSVVECKGVSYEEYKELEDMANKEICRAIYGASFASFRSFADYTFKTMYQQLPPPPDFSPPVDPASHYDPAQIAGALPPKFLKERVGYRTHAMGSLSRSTITMKGMEKMKKEIEKIRRERIEGSFSFQVERKMYELKRTIEGDLVRMPRRIDWDDFDI